MTPTRPVDDFDAAYLALRRREVPPHEVSQLYLVCAAFKEQLDRGLAAREAATVAAAVDRLAINCPHLRDAAVAALDFESQPRSDPDEVAYLVVRFHARIEPGDRIYWASAFLDGRRYATGFHTPGTHVLFVEFHVLSTDGPPALHVVKARKLVNLAMSDRRGYEVQLLRRSVPGNRPTFEAEVVEGDPPTGEVAVAALAGAPPSPPTQALPPNAGGRRKSPVQPRFPRELTREKPWWTHVHVCVDSQGVVKTVAPIRDNVHPRLFAAVLESFVRAEYIPLRGPTGPVPFCTPVRLEVRSPPASPTF